MISLPDSNFQAKITCVILLGILYSVSANSLEILGIMDYDLTEAERQLSKWQSRQQDDCIIVGRNLLTIRKMKVFCGVEEQM